MLYHQRFSKCEVYIHGIVITIISPNVVTCFGFCFLILSSYTCLYYSPDFSNHDIPNWVFLLNAVLEQIVYIFNNQNRFACSLIKRWITVMESKHEKRIAALHWEIFAIMAVTRWV